MREYMLHKQEALGLFSVRVNEALSKRPKPKPIKLKKKKLPDCDGLPTPERAEHAGLGFKVTENQEPVNQGEETDSAAQVPSRGYKIASTIRSVIEVSQQKSRVSAKIASKVLGVAEAHALSKYLENYNVVESKASSQQYGMPGGGGGFRTGGGLPCSEEEWSAGNWLNYVHSQLPLEHRENLQKINDLFHAEKREATTAALGHRLTGQKTIEAQEGGIIGYFKAVGQLLHELDRNYQGLLAKKYLVANQKIKYRS